MGYFAQGVPERVFAPHLRGLVVGSFIGLCSYINFVACRRGLTRFTQTKDRARRMSHICVTPDISALRGCPSFVSLEYFWVWVAGDPRSKAPSELGYVACTVSIAISEVIQIIGPDLHHFRSLIDKRSAVVGPAQRVGHTMCELLFNPVGSKA